MTSKKKNKAEEPKADKTKENKAEQPFVSHLVELRDRLLRVVIVMAVIFLVFVSFSNEIFNIYLADLKERLPEGSELQAVGLLDPFWVPLKFVMSISFLLVIPVALHQLWGFIAPGLYSHERKLASPFIVSSTMLFYAGMSFAFFVVLPLLYWFMGEFSLEGLAVWNPEIGNLLKISFKLMFAFGIAFQVPIFVILLCWMGITTPQALREKRPYVIVGCFVFGMLLTPPDPMSQTLLAIPMWLLFEAGVIISAVFLKKRAIAAEEAEKAEAVQDADDDMTDEEMEAELDKAIDEESDVNKGDVKPEV